jgi:hypothetical protein
MSRRPNRAAARVAERSRLTVGPPVRSGPDRTRGPRADTGSASQKTYKLNLGPGMVTADGSR